MKIVAVFALAFLAACASRNGATGPEDLIPGDMPEWSHATAHGSVITTSLGAELLSRETKVQEAGATLSAAGTVMMAATLVGAEIGARERDHRIARDELARSVESFLERQRAIDRLELPKPVTPPPELRRRGDSPLLPEEKPR